MKILFDRNDTLRLFFFPKLIIISFFFTLVTSICLLIPCPLSLSYYVYRVIKFPRRRRKKKGNSYTNKRTTRQKERRVASIRISCCVVNSFYTVEGPAGSKAVFSLQLEKRSCQIGKIVSLNVDCLARLR